MTNLFNTVIYEPLYNGLIFLTSIIPGADLGIAIILLTLIVKFAILPITHKSTKTQVKMKLLEPEMKSLRDKHKDNKEEQARQMMDLYKKHKVNPFSSCLGLLIQLPIIIGLYWVFWKGLQVNVDIALSVEHIPGYINSKILNNDILYSFVHIPDFLRVEFLGFINMTGKSVFLALLAGITQYIQIKMSMGEDGEKFSLQSSGSFKDDLAKSMKFQMRYILPVFVFVFAYSISSAVALYWVTSNVFTIGHEFLVRKKTEDVIPVPK